MPDAETGRCLPGRPPAPGLVSSRLWPPRMAYRTDVACFLADHPLHRRLRSHRARCHDSHGAFSHRLLPGASDAGLGSPLGSACNRKLIYILCKRMHVSFWCRPRDSPAHMQISPLQRAHRPRDCPAAAAGSSARWPGIRRSGGSLRPGSRRQRPGPSRCRRTQTAPRRTGAASGTEPLRPRPSASWRIRVEARAGLGGRHHGAG
jgi:hypothetical protein